MSMSKQYRQERVAYIQAIKMDSGCEICGYNEHPTALEFDHIDPSTKRDKVSNLMGNSYEVIDAEIAKCRVLCSNCHAIHTNDPDFHKQHSDKQLELW